MRLASEQPQFIGYMLGGRQICRGTMAIPQHPARLRPGLRQMSPWAAGGMIILAVKQWEWGLALRWHSQTFLDGASSRRGKAVVTMLAVYLSSLPIPC